MKNNLLGFFAGSLSALLLLGSIGVVHAQDTSSTNNYVIKARLGGKDRFETAQKISDEYINENGTSLNNLILATGNDFPDSLSANVLAAKLNAPILLINGTAKNSASTLNYINNKVAKDGNIYLVGGGGAVGSDVITQLISMGFNNNNIHRLDGKDRFGTNASIYNNIKGLGVTKGTPIVLVTASDFPDALSISSIAAIKGYPIVLTDSSSLSSSARDIISDDQPSQVFLIGGTGVLKPQIKSDIKSILLGISDTNIIQIGGKDRYDTSALIMQYFQLGGTNCVLATGETFPDGITGGVLATKLNAPILLISDSSLDKQQLQIHSMNNISSITILGEDGAISKKVEKYFSHYLYGFDIMYGCTTEKYNQISAAGYSFVCRYYTSKSNCLTQQEAKSISKSGLKIVPVFEDGGKSVSYFNKNQGIADAQNAINIAQSVGQPANTVIYFAVDFDTSIVGFSEVNDYFNGIKYVMDSSSNSNKYKVGVYGSYYVINEVKSKLGQDTYTWQTYGWSDRNININSNIYQYQNNTYLFGINIDRDRTNSSDINNLGGFSIAY